MRKSLPVGSTALFVLLLALFLGCKNAPDDPVTGPVDNPVKQENPPVPPVPLAARSFDLAAKAGDTAFKAEAAGGALAPDLKVYIKNDGTAVTITRAAAVAGFTEYTGDIRQTPGTVTVRGLAGAQVPGGPATLSSGGPVRITLEGNAQTAQVTSVSGLSKRPMVLGYSSGPYKIAGSASNTKATVFYSAAEGKIKEGYGSGMNEAVADPAIDWEFVTLFTNLQVNDTFTVNNLGVLTAASFEVLPAALDNFTTVLSFVPAVTLNVDYAPDRDVTIPAGPVKFSIAAGKTLTVAAGRALTLAENAVVALTGTGSITLTNDDVLPGRIIFAGNGARLNAGGSGSGRITGAGGVLAPAGSVDQNKIPVSSFTDLVITGGNNTLSSIAYGGGVKPCVTGPKNSAGSSAKISASTDCM